MAKSAWSVKPGAWCRPDLSLWRHPMLNRACKGVEQGRWASGRTSEELKYEEDPYNVSKDLHKHQPAETRRSRNLLRQHSFKLHQAHTNNCHFTKAGLCTAVV